jgi:hypothetical protein
MRALFLLTLAVGCASSTAPDPGLEGLALQQVAPGTIIPGTKVFITGASFVEPQWGETTLHLTGDGVDVRWPATFVDFGTMTVTVDASMIAEIGGATDFRGTAQVDVIAVSDGETYSTDELAIDLAFRDELTPTPTTLDSTGVIFVNDNIQIEGDGFLLGGDEGITVAKLEGCFTPEAGGACDPIAGLEIPMSPLEPLSRTKAAFPFSPRVAGIKPGTFTGRVTVINQQTALSPIAADGSRSATTS